MDKKPLREGISRHFKREAKLMLGYLLLPTLLALVALFVGVFAPQVMRFIEADRCLDAGGSFNSETRQCQLTKPQSHKRARLG